MAQVNLDSVLNRTKGRRIAVSTACTEEGYVFMVGICNLPLKVSGSKGLYESTTLRGGKYTMVWTSRSEAGFTEMTYVGALKAFHRAVVSSV